jgi:hypothetical protein
MKVKSELVHLLEKPNDQSRDIIIQAINANMNRLLGRFSAFKAINREYLQTIAPRNPGRRIESLPQNQPLVVSLKQGGPSHWENDNSMNDRLFSAGIYPLHIPMVKTQVGEESVVFLRKEKLINRSAKSKKDVNINIEKQLHNKNTPEKTFEVYRQINAQHNHQESNQDHSRNQMVFVPSSNVESFDSELHDTERIHQSIVEKGSLKSQRTIHESQIVKNGRSGFQMSNKLRRASRPSSQKKHAPVEGMGSQLETSNERPSKNSLLIIPKLRINGPVDLNIVPITNVNPPCNALDRAAVKNKSSFKTIIESYLTNRPLISQLFTLVAGEVIVDINSKSNNELIDLLFHSFEIQNNQGFLPLMFRLRTIDHQSLKALVIAAECSMDPYFIMAVTQHLLKHKRKNIRGDILVMLLRMVARVSTTRRLRLVIARYSVLNG